MKQREWIEHRSTPFVIAVEGHCSRKDCKPENRYRSDFTFSSITGRGWAPTSWSTLSPSLKKIRVGTPWILSLDADERITRADVEKLLKMDDD